MELIGALGGFAVVVAGTSAWLSKIWTEKVLEKDRQHYRKELESLKSKYEAANKTLQSQLGKIVHVHRVQFETEFKALTEIWAKVADLRSEMAGLRPQVDTSVGGEDAMEKYGRRLPRFSQTLEEVKGCCLHICPVLFG